MGYDGQTHVLAFVCKENRERSILAHSVARDMLTISGRRKLYVCSGGVGQGEEYRVKTYFVENIISDTLTKMGYSNPSTFKKYSQTESLRDVIEPLSDNLSLDMHIVSMTSIIEKRAKEIFNKYTDNTVPVRYDHFNISSPGKILKALGMNDTLLEDRKHFFVGYANARRIEAEVVDVLEAYIDNGILNTGDLDFSIREKNRIFESGLSIVDWFVLRYCTLRLNHYYKDISRQTKP